MSSLAAGPPLELTEDDPADVVAALDRAATRFPEHGVVTVTEDGTVRRTYSELAELAGRLLGGLLARGARPGDPVVLHGLPLADFFPAFWACLLGGLVPVPMVEPDPVAGAERLGHLRRLLGQPLVLAAGDRLDQREPGPRHRPAPDEVAVLMLSSGSTGRPKAVRLPHRALALGAAGCGRALGLRPEHVTLNWLPIDHSGALLLYHVNSVFAGATNVHVSTELVLADPVRWLDLLAEYRVGHSWAPTFGYQLVVDALAGVDRRWDLSAVRTLLCGGEQITTRVAAGFLAATAPFGVRPGAFVPAWGMTETASAVTYGRYDEPGAVHQVLTSSLGGTLVPATAGDDERDRVTFVAAGAPVAGVTVRVVDADGTVLPERRIGRLQVSSARVTPGYLADPDADRAAFPTGDRTWLESGDLAFVDGGAVTITGRVKDVIILNGRNHFCHEIEDVVRAAGFGAAGVAACGVPDERTGSEELVVFVVGTGEERAVREALFRRSRIGRCRVVFLPEREFPRTPNGKVRRSELRDRLLAGEYDLPARVGAVVAEVLGRQVDPNTPFFELGLTSVTLAKLRARLADQLGVPIPATVPFRHPTVTELAAHLATHPTGPSTNTDTASHSANDPIPTPTDAPPRRTADPVAAGAPEPPTDAMSGPLAEPAEKADTAGGPTDGRLSDPATASTTSSRADTVAADDPIAASATGPAGAADVADGSVGGWTDGPVPGSAAGLVGDVEARGGSVGGSAAGLAEATDAAGGCSAAGSVGDVEARGGSVGGSAAGLAEATDAAGGCSAAGSVGDAEARGDSEGGSVSGPAEVVGVVGGSVVGSTAGSVGGAETLGDSVGGAAAGPTEVAGAVGGSVVGSARGLVGDGEPLGDSVDDSVTGPARAAGVVGGSVVGSAAGLGGGAESLGDSVGGSAAGRAGAADAVGGPAGGVVGDVVAVGDSVGGSAAGPARAAGVVGGSVVGSAAGLGGGAESLGDSVGGSTAGRAEVADAVGGTGSEATVGSTDGSVELAGGSVDVSVGGLAGESAGGPMGNSVGGSAAGPADDVEVAEGSVGGLAVGGAAAGPVAGAELAGDSVGGRVGVPVGGLAGGSGSGVAGGLPDDVEAAGGLVGDSGGGLAGGAGVGSGEDGAAADSVAGSGGGVAEAAGAAVGDSAGASVGGLVGGLTGDRTEDPVIDRRVAIVGMAVRFPGADTVEQFWANLRAGVDSVRTFGPDELAAAGVADRTDPARRPVGGVLDDATGFDAAFFGISPREAELTDPAHRQFLECCYHALENAGYAGPERGYRVGVFAGAGMHLYGHQDQGGPPGLATTIGTEPDFLATRVAYRLGLTGPAVGVRTACSTSLVAVHLAATAVLAGDADLAIAGAAAVRVPQETGYRHEPGSILSATGRCRAFDAAADGTVGGNGVAAVVLKPLRAALADGDVVHAVILGSAVNNDGRGKVGFTAPSVPGQADVIRRALTRAGVSADTIGYVEAHGTGTELGDPVEFDALCEAFRSSTDRVGFCALGSVKPNVGHLDTCAGMAGLVKAALMVRHGELVPTVHLTTPNPALQLADSPFVLATESRKWTVASGPRRAGVSAFGVGGTNAHVILEEPPPMAPGPVLDRPVLVPLSTQDESALTELMTRLREHLLAQSNLRPIDVAHTLAVGRPHLPIRAMAVGSTTTELAQSLVRGGEPVGPLVFAFSGQGKVGSAERLAEVFPVARRVFDECARVSPEVRVAGTQPAAFAFQVVLVELWRSVGVTPSRVTGHSLGEYAALYAAGALSLVDGVRLVAARGAAMARTVPGGMVAVTADLATVREIATASGTEIAAVNGVSAYTLAGPTEAVQLATELSANLVQGARKLPVSVAFHSALIDPALPELRHHANQVDWRPLAVPMISGMTGHTLPVGTLVDADLMCRQARECVRFDLALSTMANADVVEIGPGEVLAPFGRRVKGAARWLSSREPDPAAAFLHIAGDLYRSGVDIDWTALTAPNARRVVLPPYPFRRNTPPASVPQLPSPTTLDEVRHLTAELLGLPPEAVNPAHTFVAMGADSLTMMSMVRDLNERYGTKVPVRHLFDKADTPTKLATALAEGSPPAPQSATTTNALPTTLPPPTTPPDGHNLHSELPAATRPPTPATEAAGPPMTPANNDRQFPPLEATTPTVPEFNPPPAQPLSTPTTPPPTDLRSIVERQLALAERMVDQVSTLMANQLSILASAGVPEPPGPSPHPPSPPTDPRPTADTPSPSGTPQPRPVGTPPFPPSTPTYATSAPTSPPPLPPDARTALPSTPNPPPSAPTPPPATHSLPPTAQSSPLGAHSPSPNAQPPSSDAQSLPPAKQSFPPSHHSLPAGAQSLPAGAQSLPVGAQSIPAGAQTFPSDAPTLPPGAHSFPLGAHSSSRGAQPRSSGTQPFPAGAHSVSPGAQSFPAAAQSSAPDALTSPPSAHSSSPGAQSPSSGAQSFPAGAHSHSVSAEAQSFPPDAQPFPAGAQSFPAGARAFPLDVPTSPPGAQSLPLGAQSFPLDSPVLSPGAHSSPFSAHSSLPGAQSFPPEAPEKLPGAQSSPPGAQSPSLGAQSLSEGVQSDSIGARSDSSGEVVPSAAVQAIPHGAQSPPPGEQSLPVDSRPGSLGEQSSSSGAQPPARGASSSSSGAQSRSLGAQSLPISAQSAAPGAQSLSSGAQSLSSGPPQGMASSGSVPFGEELPWAGTGPVPPGAQSLTMGAQSSPSGAQSPSPDAGLPPLGTRSLPPGGQLDSVGVQSLPPDGQSASLGVRSLPPGGQLDSVGVQPPPFGGRSASVGAQSVPSGVESGSFGAQVGSVGAGRRSLGGQVSPAEGQGASWGVGSALVGGRSRPGGGTGVERPGQALETGGASVSSGSGRVVDFSLYFFGDYPDHEQTDKYHLIIAAAEFADERGFHALWLPERHFHSFGALFPNPSVLAAALAARTTRIRLHAGSVVLPLHHPIRVAEEWSVVDNLSGGRAGLCVASGWHATDFVLAPENFGRHRDLLYTHLATLRRLWAGEAVSATSGSGDTVDVRLHPRPLQPAPPMFVAVVGNSDSYRLAAEHDLGVVTNLMAQDLPQLTANIARYRQRRADLGLGPGRVVVLVHTYLGDDLDRVRADAFRPFVDYLRSSLSLFNQVTNSLGIDVDLDTTPADDVDFLLERAYHRYCESRALIGTPDSCAPVLDGLLAAGVDEIACFVDFGVPRELVLHGLSTLDKLRLAHQQRRLPLSPAQRRIWFLDRLYPGQTIYHEPKAIRLTGPLDLPAFHAALRQVVARQPALRTVFRDDDGEPYRLVHPTVDFDCPVLDRPNATETDVIRAALADTEVFDLATGPLLAARLYRLADQHHLLFLTAHHIVFDSSSTAVLLRDLAAGYRAFPADPDLPPLPDPAPDRPTPPDVLDYWRTHLAGAPALRLPTDHPRPPRRTGVGAGFSHDLDADLTDRLDRRAREHGVTMFMTLLGAVAAVLGRFAGQTDLVLGTAVANRPRGTENVIGLLLDTVALRLDLTGDPTFGDLVTRVRDTTMTAYEHQVPFDELVRALNPERDPGANPLFQVMVEYENEAAIEFAPPLAAVPLDVPADRAPFDLALYLTRHPAGVRIGVEYDTDLFTDDTVRRVLRLLEQTLRRAADAPTTRLSALTAPTDADRADLASWRPAVGTDQRCLHHLVERQVDRTPDAVALIAGDTELTYRQLDERANQIANTLRHHRLGPGALVAVQLPRGPELIAALLGVLKAGAAYLPIDPTLPAARVDYLLQDSGARLLPPIDADAATTRPAVPVDPDDPAYCIYTSGSTGRPKGVLVPHRGPANVVAWQVGQHPPLRTLQWTSPAFDVSVQEIVSTLAAGASLVLVDDALRYDPVALAALLREQAVQRLFMPCTPLKYLMETAPDLPALRVLVSAGEALVLTPALRRFLGTHPDCVLDNQYGPTEGSIIGTAHRVDRTGPADQPIGAPIDNVTVDLLDARRRPVPIGAVGEIHLGGVAVAAGYLNRPRETAAAFVADPRRPGARLYRAGDLGRWRADGTIEFLGRRDDQVKIRGYRVEPGEAERALLDLDGVRDAAVVVRRDRNGEAELVGYVVLDHTDLDAVLARLRAVLPGYLVPTRWSLVDRLPVTANGKLDLARLPEPTGGPGTDGPGGAEPATELERTLHELWCAELGRPAVPVDRSFFALGGHSLAAVRLLNRVADRVGLTCSMAGFFADPTIRGLAGNLAVTVPLTLRQRRGWRRHHEQPDPAIYHVTHRFDLRGPLDEAALRRALTGLVARHEVLRTRIVSAETQEILAPFPVELPVEDLTGRDDDALDRWCLDLAAAPFALDQAPLFRVRLGRVGPDHRVLVLVLHHLVCDGWSLGVLWRELSALYTGADLAPAPSFAAHALAERERLGERRAELDRFWRTELAGADLTLRLPTDRPRPATRSGRGQRLASTLSPALVAGVRATASRLGATAYAVLATAFARWAATACAQPDLVLPTSVANRGRPEHENLVGLLGDAVPVRIRVGDLSADELVRVVAGTLYRAVDHGDLSLAEIVAAVAGAAAPNLLFTVVTGPPPAPVLPGVEVTPRELSVPGLARTELYVRLVVTDAELTVCWEYSTDLFDHATVAGWDADLRRLLAEITR